MTRLATTTLPLTDSQSFLITASEKSYAHQYANIYYQRLTALKPVIQRRAVARWARVPGQPKVVERVLEVTKGHLCWVIGTVYMDMRLKPNVLDDIARDRSIPAPAPPTHYSSPDDEIMLEDESGRLRLTGDRLAAARLVTGVIVGVLGMEAPDGDFQVVDLCTAGLPPRIPQPQPAGDDAMEVDEKATPDERADTPDEWLALVSGLDIGAASPADAQLQLLIEYLTGASPAGPVPPAHISRLIIAGNSLALPSSSSSSSSSFQPTSTTTATSSATDATLKARRYGSNPTFSPHPAALLSAALLDLARALPVHVLPGATDPAGAILPQAPFPRALFGAAAGAGVVCESNPAWVRLGAAAKSKTPQRTLLLHAGQPLDDIWKYLPAPAPADVPDVAGIALTAPSSPSDAPSSTDPASNSNSNTNPTTDPSSNHNSKNANADANPTADPSRADARSRLSIAAATLAWRHMAPTAPDTLWCHPFLDRDPFLIAERPDVYVVGCQPAFATRFVRDGEGGGEDGAGGGGGGKKKRKGDGRGKGKEQADRNGDGDGGEGTDGTRVILLPSFAQTGVLVLLNLRTLRVRRVKFGVRGIRAGGGDDGGDMEC